MNTNRISVFEVLESPFAISTDDGTKIFDRVKAYFDEKQQVVVDFDQVELIVSTFLNAAIGQLYGVYDSDFIKEHFSVENMSAEDAAVLQKVIDTAKEFFSRPNGFSDILNDHLSDGE
jgi:hypothetical protein